MQPGNQSLRPCPFSSYRIPNDQAWRLVKVFATYQCILSALLVLLYFTQLGPNHLGSHAPKLYEWTTLGYLTASFASLYFLIAHKLGYRLQAVAHISLDLIAIPLIIFACGGLQIGFGILLAVTVAAGGLLIGGRCALGIAALASISVLAVEAAGDLLNAFDTTSYSYAGMLGTAYFTIALLSIALAQQAEKSEALAEQRGIDLANLKQLNEFIVQHLQSGILILDETYRIRLLNDSALRLLKLDAKPSDLADLPDRLIIHFRRWLQQPESNSVTLQSDSDSIHVRFSRLTTQGETLTMIFLEDVALYQQRVQESKLASLGRLTAGIAHEIRNPLSAISHAGQLLGENPALDAQDQRLVEIIQNHSRRVNDIIGNVLELSRRKPSQRSKLNMAHWLPRFYDEFKEEHLGLKDVFEIHIKDEPLYALVDASQLRQILTNLCTNALKYGATGDKNVEIHLYRHPEQDKPTLEVVDYGPGIPPDTLRQVFDPFFTTSSTGTGLGLYIARELAQLNQATLEYEKNSRQGSRFRIILADAEQLTVEL
ncbi:MAG TPA: HAMP domain-containing histidine kinase [Methylothermaceae bacterium]|nr:HAMP domain-containing histidine kinase [Methylothermaceae bacterium]